MHSPRQTESVYQCPRSTPAPPINAPAGRSSTHFASHQRQSYDAKKVKSRQCRGRPEIKYPHYMQRRDKATWMNMEYYYNTGKSSEVKFILPGNRNSVWLRGRVSQPVDEIMANYKQETERDGMRVFQRDMYNTPGEMSLLRGWENNSSTPRIVHRNYNIVIPGAEVSLPDRSYSASVAFPRREPRHLRNGASSVAERLLHLPSAAATRPNTVSLRSGSQYDARLRQSKTSSPDPESRATSAARITPSPLYAGKLLSGRSNMTNVAQIMAKASVSPDYYDQFRRQTNRSSRVQVTPWARNVLVYRQPVDGGMYENVTNLEATHDKFDEFQKDDIPDYIGESEFLQDELPNISQDGLPEFANDNRPEYVQNEINELGQADFPGVVQKDDANFIQDKPPEFPLDEIPDEILDPVEDEIFNLDEDRIPDTFAQADSLRLTSELENIITEKLLQDAQDNAVSLDSESDDMSIQGLDNP